MLQLLPFEFVLEPLSCLLDKFNSAKMKFRLIYLLFFGVLCFTVLPGNKNGRASEAKKGNTGAPGDETNSNGSPRICSYCHFGAAGPVVFIHLLDANGDTITQYVPGQQYKARVAIDNNNPSLTGYGFQMIALRNVDTTDLDGFSDPGNNTVNNYKIATIANGRTYAEHDNISNSKLFDVVWTAPAAGTGPVTFYAAGNAVNRNGTTSGDGTASDVLQINEDISAAANDQEAQLLKIEVWPNPARQFAHLNLELSQAGKYHLQAFKLSGQPVWVSNQNFQSGTNRVDLPVASWMPGLYILEITNGRFSQRLKVLKL